MTQFGTLDYEVAHVRGVKVSVSSEKGWAPSDYLSYVLGGFCLKISEFLIIYSFDKYLALNGLK